jgi:hypothetical protein
MIVKSNKSKSGLTKVQRKIKFLISKNTVMNYRNLLGFLLVLFSTNSQVQSTETLPIQVFQSPHLIHGQTSESLTKGVIDFRINHRFGEIKSGLYDFFGADQATTSLSLEYGLRDNIMFGLRRSSLNKTYELFGKYRLSQQSEGGRNIPLSFALYFNTAYMGAKWLNPERDNLESSRYAYTTQLILARKFSERLSLQILPTWVHRNLVKYKNQKNDLFALGMGGSLKLNYRFALTFEYYWVNHSQSDSSNIEFRNPLSIGLDIKTGAHVFQLFFSNSTQVAEKAFIGETTGDPFKGEIFFGFNISKGISLK